MSAKPQPPEPGAARSGCEDGGAARGRLIGYLRDVQPRVEEWLDRFLPPEDCEPAELHRAMRYSVFSGGKRLRPGLAVFAAELFDPDPEIAAPVAAALEYVHTYSLIHDDLPCMDDDDLRRGRPTSHKVFGEAMAVLAGDALLTRGMEVIVHCRRSEAIPALLSELGRAAGSVGMVGGQVLDLQSSFPEGEEARPETLIAQVESVHRKKTAAMITASVVMGAVAAGADEEAQAALRDFGSAIGLAFQIADDVLDVVGSAAELGKTPGKDDAAGKPTFASVLGLEEARRCARSWVDVGLRALHPLGARISGGATLEKLETLAHFVVQRTH